MHISQFWPQNSLQMANTIKNWISLNLRESEKNEKNTSNDLTSFFYIFLVMFSNKNGCAHIKKTRQNIDGIFSAIFDFDKKPSRYVSCSVHIWHCALVHKTI